MPIPDFQAAMLPVLRAFAEGAENVSQVLPRLRAEFAVTDEEARQMLPSGRVTLLQDRAHWARTYLSKAGLLHSPRRNVHVITEEGRRVLAANPPRIDRHFLEQFAPYRDWQARVAEGRNGEGASEAPGSPVSESGRGPSQSPEERIEAAFAEIEGALTDDLLSLVQSMDALRFERLVLDLLTAMGYGTGSFGTRALTPAAGDGGIDGVIHEDALGLDAVYVQAKRYQPEAKVGRPAIQAFVGALTGEGATKGVFVTTSGFTAEARDYLRRVSHRVVLIDGPELARRMIRHGVGVRVRRTYELKAVDSDYFEDEG